MGIQEFNRQDIIDKIIEHMIDILVIDYNNAGSTTQDKRNIDYRYTNNQTINAIVKKCSALCLRDYSYDILRDEVYASIYEIMLNISDEYTLQQLIDIYNDIDTKESPITNQFFVSVYKLTILKVKLNLSGYRRCSTGMIEAKDMCEYTEEILNSSPDANFGFYIDNLETDHFDLESNLDQLNDNMSFFMRWFKDNKEDFLTKKQIAFLEDTTKVNEKNHSSYKSRIYNNTLNAYIDYFDESNSDRRNELTHQIKIIESILESKDFIDTYNKHKNKNFIIDAITDNVNLSTMRSFNNNTNNINKLVIYEYRVALLKKLNELNILLNI